VFQFCRVLVNRRNGTTNAESYPQLTTSYSRTQKSRRSAFGNPLGSHPELRYLKERREIFLKRTEKFVLLAAIDDLTVQIMPNNGGKSRTFHGQEFRIRRGEIKTKGFGFCLVALSWSKYDSGFARFLCIFTDSLTLHPYVHVEA
jgi:hypothetical protein